MKLIRTCIACRKKQDKKNVNKVVKNKNNEISLDYNQNLEGRSCYFCKDNSCIEKVCKNKIINRAFKINVGDEIYKQIEMLKK